MFIASAPGDSFYQTSKETGIFGQDNQPMA